jgi:hypothetical protein
MILRSILLLGVGAALACSGPAFAAGATAPATTQTAKSQTQTVAALETATPDTAQTQKVSKPKAKTKKVAKAKGKKKKPAVAEARNLKSGLLPSLFGGSKKPSSTPDSKNIVKTADARPVVTIRQRAKPVEPERSRSTLIPPTPELRSESRRGQRFCRLLADQVAAAAGNPCARFGPAAKQAK